MLRVSISRARPFYIQPKAFFARSAKSRPSLKVLSKLKEADLEEPNEIEQANAEHRDLLKS